MNRLVFKRCFSSAGVLNKNYGFVGLGRMGLNMAKNIESKMSESDKLFVYDVNEQAMNELGPGILKMKSPVEVAQNSDVIITMLPEGKHVRKVYGEIARSNMKSKLFIDSSTIDVKTSIETAQLLKQNGIGKFVDAPVSGGVVGAKNGTLTFMVGSNDLTELESTLSFMGKRIVPCGEPGSGISAKLCNNYLLALNNIATAEAFSLASHLKLDLKVFSDIVNTSTGRCWPSEVNNPVPGINPNTPSSNDYNGGFGLALMNKDLKLAIEAAKQYDCELPISKAAAGIYQTCEDDSSTKGKDMSVIYKWLSKNKN